MKELLLNTSPISFLEGKLRQYGRATEQTKSLAKTIDMPDKSDALLYKTLPALKEHAAQIRETVDQRLSQKQQQLAPWLAQNPKGPYRLIKVSEALGYTGHPDPSTSRLIRQAATNLGLDGKAKSLDIPTGQFLIKVCEEYQTLKEQQKKFREREKSRLASARDSHTQPESTDPLESAIANLGEEARSILQGPVLQKIATRFGTLEANEFHTFSFQCYEHGLNSVTVAIPPEYLESWAPFVNLQPSGKCIPNCRKKLFGIERYQILK